LLSRRYRYLHGDTCGSVLDLLRHLGTAGTAQHHGRVATVTHSRYGYNFVTVSL
jgi:hypothetical protein